MKRQRDNHEGIIESIDLANCLMLLSHHAQQRKFSKSFTFTPVEEFECTTCNRKFSSFQALGGHRASHKRQKLDGDQIHARAKSLNLANKPKIHECSICGLEFSLGQALGGHMRRHRVTTSKAFQPVNQVVDKVPVLKRSDNTRVLCLDLNLTPLENDLKLLLGTMTPTVEGLV